MAEYTTDESDSVIFTGLITLNNEKASNVKVYSIDTSNGSVKNYTFTDIYGRYIMPGSENESSFLLAFKKENNIPLISKTIPNILPEERLFIEEVNFIRVDSNIVETELNYNIDLVENTSIDKNQFELILSEESLKPDFIDKTGSNQLALTFSSDSTIEDEEGTVGYVENEDESTRVMGGEGETTLQAISPQGASSEIPSV